ncbi:MAG: alpha/beta hydrolase [Anaerolineae bacterium]|nr:alpha/beta hydrolase [Anaerolineae bacterium]
MFRLKKLLILILFMAGLPLQIIQSQGDQPDGYPEFVIPNTETIAMSSGSRDYQILVGLPENYSSSDPNRRYSVVYVLDANYYFGAVTDFIRVENLVQELPNLIVVGIGYPQNPLGERITDMLENPDQFLAFIGNELIPFIDSHYQTDASPAERTLIGHSLGGQFVLYSLFSNPELFSRYVAASPGSPGWDTIIPLEADFSNDHSELPVSLFMSSGEEEQIRSLIEDMFATIQSRDYDELEATYFIIENATHGSSAIPAITYGLRYVYDV